MTTTIRSANWKWLDIVILGRSLAVVTLAISLGACTYDIAAPPATITTSPMIVSNVATNASAALGTRQAPATAAAQSTSKSNASYTFALTGAEPNVAYVSLLPNTAPGGDTAIVSDARTGAIVSAPMVDGGLDPVPLSANPGDTIHINVQTAGGGSGPRFDKVVPFALAPTVVRTIPSRGKTAVPLNKSIEIIFSEPVSAPSLSASSIQLFRGSTQVSGTAKLLAGVTAAAVFEPASQLEPNTEYQLVVNRAVMDLDGTALDSTVTIPFTTGTTVEGPVAGLSLVPGNVIVRVGDQFQATVTAMDAQGNALTGKPITWSFSGPDVIKVTPTGLVTPVSPGSGVVYAQVERLYTAMLVQVSNTLNDVGSVTLSVDTATIAIGDSAELSVVARDPDDNLLRNRLVRWSSTNPGVATVKATASDAARVTGVSSGITKIIADIDGTKDTTVVSVGLIPSIAGIVLTEDVDSILLGQREQLMSMSRNAAGGRAPVPANDVQWESSNTAVLTVNASGIIAGVSPGSATVTARWSGFSATQLFSVTRVAFQTLSAGKAHVCGLSASGIPYCWGAGDFGQIGRPGVINPLPSAPGQIYYPWPVTVTGQPTFSSVSAGGLHTCGLRTDGVGYCWGYNGDGSLGNGSTATGWRAMPVFGGLRFVELDAGTTHTCGLTVTHAAYCWGSNQGGQLGSVDVASSLTPLGVQGGISFASLAVGGSHTCGLTAAGVAYCWGNNAGGQLGAGDIGASSATPLAVQGGLTFASLSAGESHTCGLTSAGALYCWGWNFEGELGNGNGPTPSAVPSAVVGGHTFLVVRAGGNHTCAIDAAHAAYCWGSNANGQLGIGSISSTNFMTPQPVVGGLAFEKLSVGASVSCAATVAGVWYCWGNNSNGALGVGSKTADSATPLKGDP